MANYCVNKIAQTTSGDHEVHNLEECSHLPDSGNRIKLGSFNSCGPAVTAAKKIYPQSNGCYHCSRPCHTG